jgi:catechol 2,3-dioxygenase-like lactoylglutathione lyase family enzyme
MLSNAKISAVVPVTDLDRARTFYEGVLGLRIFKEDFDRGTVIYHSADTYLLIYQRQTASSGEHTVVAFEIDGDVEAVLDGLLERGITFDTFEIPGVDMPWDARGILRDGDNYAAWFKDPDGNVINVGKGALS